MIAMGVCVCGGGGGEWECGLEEKERERILQSLNGECGDLASFPGELNIVTFQSFQKN